MCFPDAKTRHIVMAMKAHRIWHGTRTRRIDIGADPDQPPRAVTVPVTWDSDAAAALAALVPGQGTITGAITGAITLAAAAGRWTRGLDPVL